MLCVYSRVVLVFGQKPPVVIAVGARVRIGSSVGAIDREDLCVRGVVRVRRDDLIAFCADVGAVLFGVDLYDRLPLRDRALVINLGYRVLGKGGVGKRY